MTNNNYQNKLEKEILKLAKDLVKQTSTFKIGKIRVMEQNLRLLRMHIDTKESTL